MRKWHSSACALSSMESEETELSDEEHKGAIMKANNRGDKLGKMSAARGWRWLRVRHGAAREEGGTLVEVAVVLPILLLIVTGIFTFGIALNNYIQLTDAVGISARLLAISRGQTTDPCTAASAAFYKAAPYLKTANLSFTFVLNGTTYTGASCSSTSTTTGAAGNLVQGQPAQITVTYPCNLAVYGKNYAPSCSLTGQVTELVQ
jgi:Flp pilus assembly protein TadG